MDSDVVGFDNYGNLGLLASGTLLAIESYMVIIESLISGSYAMHDELLY